MRTFFTAIAAACALLAATTCAFAAEKPASSISAARLIQPAELAAVVKDSSTPQPLMLHVGFRTMFDQAHIPGSEYAGPGNTAAGLQGLRKRVAALAKDREIVLYCGCCPWIRCPNVAAAFDLLQELGFPKAKVMYIANDFGADWVDQGYPTAKSK
jgi:hypothetical protein